MKTVSDLVTSFTLPAIDGKTFDLSSLKGKRYLLVFFRFASCPFCNLRVHELVKRYQEFGQNFTVVAVFDSSLENLQKYAAKHHSTFPIVADCVFR
ncbi:MAG: redoxin domain-containing protein [Methylococcales bacterium]|jgi:thioredoxin-dependent peroxiredoxin|nr:redoxin domain-containing protein [Methylococcales bacterium]MBT7444518.1 redoxin domain-containing protein [Methylococcales bacterium]